MNFSDKITNWRKRKRADGQSRFPLHVMPRCIGSIQIGWGVRTLIAQYTFCSDISFHYSSFRTATAVSNQLYRSIFAPLASRWLLLGRLSGNSRRFKAYERRPLSHSQMIAYLPDEPRNRNLHYGKDICRLGRWKTWRDKESDIDDPGKKTWRYEQSNDHKLIAND